MSAKDAIMSALADVTITLTHGAKTYNVSGIAPSDERFSIVRDVPTRIIAPITDAPDQFTFLTLNGGAGRATYRLTDLMLLRHSVAGQGIETDAVWLVKYQQAYIQAMLANRHLGMGNVSIVSIDSIEAGVYPYPLTGSQVYNGVKAELTVNEVVFA